MTWQALPRPALAVKVWPGAGLRRQALLYEGPPNEGSVVKQTSILIAVLVLLLPDAALAAGDAHLGARLPVWSVLPFAGLLLSIALFPLLAQHFWESNLHKAVVALVFGVPTALYVWFQDHHLVLHELHEYVSFIVLLGALFIISGGLVLRGDIKASPEVNTLFLGIGAVLANFIGTTGASMVLIRPVLRTNSQRRNVLHIPVFFIFVVANMGGMLTPLGDPPLFLGYLRGVPFFWTLKLTPIWAIGVGIVLAVFYVWDRRAYSKEQPVDLQRDVTEKVPLSLTGKWNLLLLGGVLVGVFLPSPWREIVMAAMAGLSIIITPRDLRAENGFTYHPITEVAVLFIGIFLAMIPALAILQARGGELGMTKPWQFFWSTGILSSFLDNAPTYLTFMSLAQGLGMARQIAGMPTIMLEAISAGAVFMGANSYIGNGPNFMVKAIADEANIRMPNFFAYMALAAMILWPIFIGVTLVFFSGAAPS
jgi:Na+/H+ antiporter NhaD/arsenite permease-like protein